MLHQSELLKKFPEIVHGFTDRELGSDYLRLAQALNIAQSHIAILSQVHSAQVWVADEYYRNRTEGDALITVDPGKLVGIRAADCVPLLFYEPKAKAAAAVHAGWRGVAYGIIENTLARLKELGVPMASLHAAIGPAICGKCYEVGPELVAELEKKFGADLQARKGRGDRYHVDLRRHCHVILSREGIPSVQIETLDYCTSCHHDLFYSYRKGDEVGRNFAFIGRGDISCPGIPTLF